MFIVSIFMILCITKTTKIKKDINISKILLTLALDMTIDSVLCSLLIKIKTRKQTKREKKENLIYLLDAQLKSIWCFIKINVKI